MPQSLEEGLMSEILIGLINAMPKPKAKRKPKKKKGPVVLPREAPLNECLYRFLLTGNKDGLYVAGQLNPNKCYGTERTSFIKEMVKDVEKAKEFVETVRFVKCNPVRNREPCYHALAVAIKYAEDPAVKNILYTEAINIADDCEGFFSLLHQMNTLKVGTGSGWRRFVVSWYKSIPPSKLASMVSQVKGRYSWSHKDVITLAHGLKPAETDVGLKVIIKYIFSGLQATTELYADEAAAKDILDTLKRYEQARQCEDSAMLATLITENDSIGLDMVLHESKNARKNTPGVVWKALLKKLSGEELLRTLQTMHNHLALVDMGCLEAQGSTELAPMVQILNRDEYKEQNVSDAVIAKLDSTKHASPVLTYIALRDYEEGRKRLSAPRVPFYKKNKKDKQTFTATATANENTIHRWGKLSRKGELVPPSPPVVEALHGLLHRSLMDQPKEKKIPGRYMVTIDARSHMFKVYQSVRKAELAKKAAELEKNGENGEANSNNTTIPPVKVYDDGKNHCFWAEHVSPGKAAVLLALYFASHVQDVTVAVFTDQGVEEVSLVKPNGHLYTMKEAEEKLTSSSLGVVSLSSPIEWALQQKKKYDLFVNVLRSTSVTWKVPKERRAQACNPHQVLYDYQKQMEMPDSGLVNISLGQLSRVRTDYNQRRIMDVFGLDEHVTQLIHTFADEKYKDKI